MRRILLFSLLLAGCEQPPAEIQTVVNGEAFDESSLVEKDKVTVLDFGANW